LQQIERGCASCAELVRQLAQARDEPLAREAHLDAARVHGAHLEVQLAANKFKLRPMRDKLKATKAAQKIELASVKKGLMDQIGEIRQKRADLINQLKVDLKETAAEEQRLKGRNHFLGQVRF
jgi:acetyl-CoA carboxylase carboxyltransferase component